MTTLRATYAGHLSTVYSATGNGTSLPLWGRATDTQFGTAYWGAGQIVPQSGCTFEADESVAIVVTKLSGAITTGKVYANSLSGPIIASTVVGGNLQFTLPQDTVAWVIVDNVLHLPLVICSRPILAIPGGVVTYNGTQTQALSGQTLYFPAGTHTIPIRFPVQSNATVFLHRDVWIIGSFNCVSNLGGHAIRGYGAISGEWAESIRLSIRSMPFATQLTYSLIYGHPELASDATIYGVTLIDSPFYTTSYGATIWDRIAICAPWWGNANGIFTATHLTNRTASITRCATWTHDDAIDFGEYIGTASTSQNIICALSASFIVAYWPYDDQKRRHVSTNDTVICINYWIPGVGSIILVWCDGGLFSASLSGESSVDYARSQVISGVTFSGTRFMGTNINGKVFDLQHFLYPYGEIAPGEGLGQIRDFVFENIVIESVPVIKFTLMGKDRWNTPHDIRFNNVVIGGTLLTVANFDTFFDRNEFPYNIFVNGQPLTDAPTTTGTWYLTDVTQSPWFFTPQTSRLGGAKVNLLPDTVAWPTSTAPSRGVIPSIGGYNWAVGDSSTISASFSFAVTGPIALTSDASFSTTAALSVTGPISFTIGYGLEATFTIDVSGTIAFTPVTSFNTIGEILVSGEVDILPEVALSVQPYTFTVSGVIEFSAYVGDLENVFLFNVIGPIEFTRIEDENIPQMPRRRPRQWWQNEFTPWLRAALRRAGGR